MTPDEPGPTIAEIRSALAQGLDPVALIQAARDRIAADDDASIWISTAPAGGVDDASAAGPLTGTTVAVKDNIDVEGVPTTAGCPAFGYDPAGSAPVVSLLLGSGATVVGKTNLDQFATGLVGTRSPHGTPTNPFDPELVPGGSSSGSAVAVARGLATFSLGTDTAGSGRVPAAINNIVGLKPTRGLVSTTGVVPACRSLDCVSIFASTVADAALVFDVVDRFDPDDVYARPHGHRSQRRAVALDELVVGVLDDAVIAECDGPWADAYVRHIAELTELGVSVRTVDLTAFLEAGELLYDGPWVAERFAAVGAFMRDNPEAVERVTRSIVLGAARFSAADSFDAEYRRRSLAARSQAVWEAVDALVVPSIPGIPSLAEVAASPVAVNARLGRFATFVNLLDLCAIAVPGGFTATGLPAGFTMIAPACHDHLLLSAADNYEQAMDRPIGAMGFSPARRPTIDGDEGAPASGVDGIVELAVVGAHLVGQPLNGQLTERGAVLGSRTSTAPRYRLYALAGSVPAKPGLVRVGESDGGASIEIEVWDMPEAAMGSFLTLVPAPLAIGKLELADGRWVSGFVCEPSVLLDATDITHHGGWRSYLGSL